MDTTEVQVAAGVEVQVAREGGPTESEVTAEAVLLALAVRRDARKAPRLSWKS